MKEKPKVTIIIPCYNGFDLSTNCMKALQNQTCNDFEVVIIDDCSTDGSFERFKQMESSIDINLHVFRNIINKGPGYSREVGISKANGEYICFCDIDDWYEFDFIESMISLIKEDEADIAFCDYNYVFKNGTSIEKKWYSGINNIEEKSEVLVSAQSSLCILMVKKKIIQALEFPHFYHGEDAAMIPLIILNCKKIAVCKKALYNYLMREDSASNNFDRKAFDNSIEVFSHIKSNMPPSFNIECEFLGIKEILYTGCLNGIKSNVDKEEIKNLVCNFKADFHDYKHNPYFKRLGVPKRFFIFLIDHNFFFFSKVFSYFHTKYIGR